MPLLVDIRPYYSFYFPEHDLHELLQNKPTVTAKILLI